MKKIVIIEKDCDNEKFSSDINEVIRAVLNFFFMKIFCMHKKHKKHKKAQGKKDTKSTKKHKNHKNITKQKHKTQISEQKLKMCLKNI